MRSELRVVIDTNVFVSALAIEDSVPFRAVETAFASGKILVSAEMLAELEDVLHRPKLQRYFAARDVEGVLERLQREGEFVTVEHSRRRSRDPKDDALLDLAVAGRADWLVTGDSDLLVLGAIGETRIVTPTVFLDAVRLTTSPATPRK